MNAEISETIRARLLGVGVRISELLAQRKLWHDNSNAHNPSKTVAPTAYKLWVRHRLGRL